MKIGLGKISSLYKGQLVNNLRQFQSLNNRSFSVSGGFLNNSFFSFCSNANTKDEKKIKTDPHNFPIYKKLKPYYGQPPEEQPLPSFVTNIPAPEDYGYEHYDFDRVNPEQEAFKKNYPIRRDSVSCYYSMLIKDKVYHVFNAARYPTGRILTQASIFLQGKSSPHFRTNKVMNSDVVVIVNAENAHLTGRKMKYRLFYKQSTKPGNLKSISAKNLIAKNPVEFFHRSLRGMLPKNKLKEEFHKNLIIYNGPDHDLHHLGLPQFDTVKPIDWDKMMGSTFDPEEDKILVTPDTDPEKVKELTDKGFKLLDEKESHLRDFMKRREYNRLDASKLKAYNAKMQRKRHKQMKRIRMRNYTFV